MPSGLRAGFRTAWTDAGSGSRKALWIHCSLARLGVWEGTLAGLANTYSSTAFDMPGHGAADPWNGGDGRDYQDVTAQIGLTFCDGPTHVIGHSFGATVALRMALLRPDLINALTLIEPVFFAVAHADDDPSYQGHVEDFEPFVAAIDRDDRVTAAQVFTDLWGGGRPWEKLPAKAQSYITDRIHLIPAGAPAIEQDVHDVLGSGALERLDVPVTLIEGAKSPPVIAAIQSGLERRLPRATRHIIDGAGHMAPMTHPQAVAEIIRAVG
ncbi:alpha/beta fold hydrolase [Algirhabdus cladophorae]|uniref:alpha/beta fold hydrolase n=1 Tax=Algirhabdus cladophorae TaxID=3377108 RepID=UPI003B847B66